MTREDGDVVGNSTEFAGASRGWLVDAGIVVLRGPLADEQRVVLAIEADTENAVRATLARDPGSETHLRIDAIEPWTIRFDGGRA